MFLLKNRNVFLLVIGLFVLVGIQGCDQISSFIDDIASKTQARKISSSSAQKKSTPKQPPTVAESTSGEAILPNVLAKIGDWTITIEEFKERLTALQELMPDYDINNTEQNKLILQELLRQQLLVQEAEQSGLAGKKEIGQAVEEFRRTLLVREVAAGIVGDITVTDEEAQEYYTQNPQDFAAPVQWRVRELVVDIEEEAKAVLVELYQGADFVAMVNQKSKAKSATEGGDLGYLSAFDFPKMEDIVSTLEVGGISSVFKGPEGFYIVKLEDTKGGELQDFAELKEELKAGLTFSKQQQAIVEHIAALQQKTAIYINDKLLE